MGGEASGNQMLSGLKVPLRQFQGAPRMMTDMNDDGDGDGNTTPPRDLSPAAKRALAEAQARRDQAAQNGTAPQREVGGRDGPDPVRYGDWEKGGIASDF